MLLTTAYALTFISAALLVYGAPDWLLSQASINDSGELPGDRPDAYRNILYR